MQTPWLDLTRSRAARASLAGCVALAGIASCGADSTAPNGSATVLTQVWAFALGGVPGTPVVGSDGAIYVPTGFLNTDASGALYAISPDGTQKWRTSLSLLPSSTAPAIATDGTIYVHGNGLEGNIVAVEKLVAISPRGDVVWIVQLNGGAGTVTSDVQSTPAVGADGTIYVGCMNGVLYAVNPNGTLKWSVSPSASSISSSPRIAADGTIYVVDATTLLSAYTPAGVRRWTRRLADSFIGTGNDQSPTIGPDGTIYVGSPDGRLYAVTAAGSVNWRVSLGGAFSIQGTPALASDGTVYMSGAGLNAVTASGTVRWTFPQPSTGIPSAEYKSTPVVGMDGIIFWRESFAFHAIRADGTGLQSIAVTPFTSAAPPSTPALSSTGILYLPLTDIFHPGKNELRAFRIR